METVKLVNRSTTPEFEILCFQGIESMKIYDLNQIDRICVDGSFRDFVEEDISYVLHTEGHLAKITQVSNGNLVLYV